MKFYYLFITISLVIFMHSARASEDPAQNDAEFRSFCNEQAQMAGMEDADEKKQYITDCLTNYGVTSTD